MARDKEKAEEPPTRTELFLDEARARLARIESVAADIQERVDMLNQHVVLTGRYLKAPKYRLYFQLTVSGLPESQGSTLQVCDGETRYDIQAILDQKAFFKFSIKPVMERLESPELDAKTKETLRDQMGFAGPETLIAGLRKLFRFDQEKEEGKLGDRSVWIFHGTWRREVRQGLTAPDQRQIAATGLLPPYIPMDVTLYLGKDDSWPYKVVLQGRKPTRLLDTRKEGVDGRKIGSFSSIERIDPTSITLEYVNVRLNTRLDDQDFAYQPPGNTTVEDGTEMIVRQLDSAIAVNAERKRVDTAKKEGPTLDQPLDVTVPPATPVVPPPPKQ